MSKLKRLIGVKAGKAAVRHSAHGLSAKAQRKPLRSVGLLAAGAMVGFAVGWSSRGGAHAS